MCRLIKSSQVGLNEGDPVICIVPPPIIHTQRLDKDFSPNFSLESDQKAKQLPGCYAALAKEEGACFCDPNQVFSTEKTDGLHFDAQGHSQMAALLEVVIQQVFT
jgi:lysophospholipase L1-like esterase